MSRSLLPILYISGILACGINACQPPRTPEEQAKADSLAIREAYAESPVLSPEEALEGFQVEEGFRVELVAAEPLVETPVAMTFDEKGRIWVVEMPGYMPDTVGTGEDQPNGKIVILEDADRDGKADKRTVFMDSLVLPRAICLIEDGLLVAEPPRLWFVENRNGKAGKKVLVDASYAVGGNVEHQPNGLYRALDNWIYNTKSDKRYRKDGDRWLIEHTVFRGQWGLSQDNQGRLFYNHNSANVLGDYFPPRFGAANPNQQNVAGYSEAIVADNRVYPLRPNMGINRGYLEGMLDDSLRLVNFTAASGPLVYRGGLFGAEYEQNVFVPEPSANLIKRNIVDYRVNMVEGRQAYKGREFLASEDERFRPVNLYDGPDGALYVVDMYRGIIQHVTYLTEYLKNEIKSRELTEPLNRGRIYRIVPAGSPQDEGGGPAEAGNAARSGAIHEAATKGPVWEFPSDASGLVSLLGHRNGWVRDKAQQLLVDRRPEGCIPLLKEKLKAAGSGIELVHALWTLEGLKALEWKDLQPLLAQGAANTDEALQAQILTLIPSVLHGKSVTELLPWLEKLAEHPRLAPYVAYVLHPLRNLAPQASSRLLENLAHKYPNQPYVADAVISNLEGREAAFLKKLEAWNADSTLIIKKRLRQVLKHIAEKEQARLKKELMKELKRGSMLYKNICQTCHGADGNGIRSMAPPLNHSEWVNGSKERLIAIVLYGLSGPVTVNGHVYEAPEISGEMPGLINNDALSDDDIAQVVSFVKNAWNNEGGLASAEDVARVKEKLKDRKGAFTVEELEKLDFEH